MTVRPPATGQGDPWTFRWASHGSPARTGTALSPTLKPLFAPSSVLISTIIKAPCPSRHCNMYAAGTLSWSGFECPHRCVPPNRGCGASSRLRHALNFVSREFLRSSDFTVALSRFHLLLVLGSRRLDASAPRHIDPAWRPRRRTNAVVAASPRHLSDVDDFIGIRQLSHPPASAAARPCMATRSTVPGP